MTPLQEMTKQRDSANVAVGCLAADREAFAALIVLRTQERDHATTVAKQLKAQLDAMTEAHPPKPEKATRKKKTRKVKRARKV